MHCCGNTDWSILMDCDFDIINFDACEYFQGMTLYTDQLKSYLNKGGVLAWGIVPTSPQSQLPTTDELQRNFIEKVELLVERGLNKRQLLKQALLTPSCGMGTLSESHAEEVLHKLVEISQQVRIQYLEKKKAG